MFIFNIIILEVIVLNNFNFDENTINKLKNMMNNGELNDVISKIPPDMIQNFNSIINASSSKTTNSSNTINATNSQDNSKKATLNLNNIDMNTIVKMKSIVDNMNNSNNPRSNLLYSLKPYLRDSRKEKIDQYANLLNFAQIAELFKKDDNTNNDNKE